MSGERVLLGPSPLSRVSDWAIKSLTEAGLHPLYMCQGNASDDPEFWRHLGTAEMLILGIEPVVDNAFLERAPYLKFIAMVGVGLDNVDLASATRREVELGVQNLMDFYCGDVRSEGLLKRGLERLEDAKAAPLRAESIHELGRCLDVKSIIDNAELVLRGSLERKESRPVLGFIRKDYPEQNDENWLVFLAVRKDENENYKFAKFPTDR